MGWPFLSRGTPPTKHMTWVLGFAVVSPLRSSGQRKEPH